MVRQGPLSRLCVFLFRVLLHYKLLRLSEMWISHGLWWLWHCCSGQKLSPSLLCLLRACLFIPVPSDTADLLRTAPFRLLRGLAIAALGQATQLSPGQLRAQTWVGSIPWEGAWPRLSFSNTWGPQDSCRTGVHHAGRRLNHPGQIFLCLWSPREQLLWERPSP